MEKNEKKGYGADILDKLLQREPTNPETAEMNILRLSREAGGDVIFKLRELGYNHMAEIERCYDANEAAIQTILAGVTYPDLKDAALLDKYHAVTPADLVKAMLTPGEIESIYKKVQELPGYMTTTLECVKRRLDVDPEAQLMLYLFNEHHILPGTYRGLPDGEKVILQAFFLKEIEKRRDAQRR